MHAAPICPYCNRLTKLTPGDQIYQRRLDLHDKNFWLCARCDAYVGTHAAGANTRVKVADGRYEMMRSDGTIPLGTPANYELRALRHSVHQRFDPLWRDSRAWKRKDAYEWLAKVLVIPRDECHIAMFTPGLCRQAIEAIDSRKDANAVSLFG